MSHSFTIYIDESGDDGLRNFRRPGEHGGSSNWLIIGACFVRSSRDLELVALRDRIKVDCLPTKPGRPIHFKDMNHGQRRRACQIISGQPLRFACVIGLKNVAEARVFVEKNQLYFYLTRYLIERVSWFCRDNRPMVREGDGRAKIVFSRRGGLSYEGFRDYLVWLRDKCETTVHWPSIDIDAVEAMDHTKLAGLQIADCGVSAVAAAIEPDRYGNVEGAYLNEIAPNLYSRKGKVLSYGLKFLPSTEKLSLSSQQSAIFSSFEA
jgi:Protein of unknown function (DUF3800)